MEENLEISKFPLKSFENALQEKFLVVYSGLVFDF